EEIRRSSRKSSSCTGLASAQTMNGPTARRTAPTRTMPSRNFTAPPRARGTVGLSAQSVHENAARGGRAGPGERFHAGGHTEQLVPARAVDDEPTANRLTGRRVPEHVPISLIEC